MKALPAKDGKAPVTKKSRRRSKPAAKKKAARS